MIGTVTIGSTYIWSVEFVFKFYFVGRGWDRPSLSTIFIFFACDFCVFIIYAEIASKHFRFAEMLYYKVLESVIEQEQKRLGDMDLSVSK